MSTKSRSFFYFSLFLGFRFGVFVGLAHAAMTAEGDNSVLMQKVAKERLAAFTPLPEDPSLPADPSSTAYLHDQLKRRENTLFKVCIIFPLLLLSLLSLFSSMCVGSSL